MEAFSVDDIQFVVRSKEDPSKFLVEAKRDDEDSPTRWSDLAGAWEYQSRMAHHDATDVNGEVLLLIHGKLFQLVDCK